MKQKQLNVKLTLVIIGFLLFFLTYFYYPYTKNIKNLNTNLPDKDLNLKTEEDKTTTFENLEYQGLYDFDKPFKIRSEKAFILNDEPDIVYMTNMNVTLNLNDGRIVVIKSDQGIYNKLNYDCFFEKNVQVTDGSTKIYAENLDLLATKNVAEIYNNVNLDYITGDLQADKIDYDFKTKNFKVSMFDNKSINLKVIK